MKPEPEWSVMHMDWKGTQGTWVGKKLYEHFKGAEELIAKLLKMDDGKGAIAQVTKPGGVEYWEKALKKRWILR